ncbi:MAG: ubiquinol-cytochrome c reductase iron-sulfur subunit [Pseudomonadota bacterium]
MLSLLTYTVAGIGMGALAWPLINSMSPAADILAAGTLEVDLSGLKPGQSKVVTWRGKPVFIRHRRPEEIKAMQETDLTKLPDPESDSERVHENNEQWLVVIGICTHLGCVPNADSGEYSGWFCPCHGSHYDYSGRIRKGPAPLNLPVPEYEFIGPNKIKIG